jgi:hypothetical protein
MFFARRRKVSSSSIMSSPASGPLINTGYLLALGALVSGIFLGSEAFAYCRMTIEDVDVAQAVTRDGCQSSGTPLAWRRRCISFAVTSRVLIDRVSGKIIGSNDNPPYENVLDMVDSSYRAWTSVTCGGEPLDFEVKQLDEPSECSEPEQNLEGANVNSVAFVWDWEERGYDEDAFAVTSVFANSKTGEILGADMELNETQGNLGNCCSGGVCLSNSCPNRGVVDIQNVVTHEAGHFFGLGHSNVRDATMYSQASVGETAKRKLKEDDINGICAIYPPGSLPERCNFNPPGGLDMQCQSSNAANPFGCTITESPGDPSRPSRPFAIFAALILPLTWFSRKRNKRLATRSEEIK